ncbi:MAG: outer membrane lipoprotein carrier protein LolA [Myxococcaceae bacterium]
MSVLLATTALLALNSAAPASTAPPSIPPELSALRESLKRTETLSAKFTQVRHLAALHDALTTEGTLEYRNGGRFVWRTSPPSESELVMDGKRVTIHYPGMGAEKTVDFSTEPGMGKVFETIRAVLQGDIDNLSALFTLSIRRKEPLSVSLSPRTEELARTVSRIQLDFDRHLHLIHVALDEPDGDSTDISFRDHLVQPPAH